MTIVVYTSPDGFTMFKYKILSTLNRQPLKSLFQVRRVDIPPDPKKIITKGFSTVFYPTGYSKRPRKSLSKSDP